MKSSLKSALFANLLATTAVIMTACSLTGAWDILSAQRGSSTHGGPGDPAIALALRDAAAMMNLTSLQSVIV